MVSNAQAHLRNILEMMAEQAIDPAQTAIAES
jgi:hypothetical protein